ncbi:hypothetical protein AB0G86_00750 [Streptomyces scabiei]|uniref:hypothetical protein n=1 Tax=Streptomyces scabiei TaxID=1930 RepID=UPI0033DD37D0
MTAVQKAHARANAAAGRSTKAYVHRIAPCAAPVPALLAPPTAPLPLVRSGPYG